MPIDRNSAQYITGATYKPTQTSAPGVWDLDDQANNVSKNLWPLPPQAVQRSLRFNVADNAYLSRTPAVAGNRRTWTWSGWIKRGLLGSVRTLISSNGTNDNTLFQFEFNGDALRLAGSATQWAVTTSLYRDPSAWYHIILATDTTQATASDRFKIYVNGVLVTSYSATSYPPQNADLGINDTRAQYIGEYWNTSPSFDGYMAEINFIDGQALTPSSFGETDQQTGVWIPKRYSGTYGTNGFRLSFANNSSTTALGYDSSGQGNNWTANNFSVTPGVGNDSLLDVPSLYGTDTGLGGEVIGNYATFNPLSNPGNSTLTNGNLDVSTPNATAGRVLSTLGPSSGRWYCEFTVTNVGAGFRTGIVLNGFNDGDIIGKYANEYAYASDGNKYSNSVSASYGATYTAGDIIGVALDLESATTSLTFYKNGVSQGVAYTGMSGIFMFGICDITGGGGVSSIANFGQRPFTYPAPAGYKALCTTNLPAPAIGQTSNNQADDHFAAITYIGNGGAKSIPVGFQPDFIWIKNRTTSNNYHNLIDSLRGANRIYSNGDANSVTNAEESAPFFAGFTSTGFDLNGNNGNVNGATESYVAWCWNAGGVSVTNNAGANGATIASTYRTNLRAGFSIVIYTGNGVVGATVRHGLSSVPGLVLIKNRSTTANWAVKMPTVMTGGQRLQLNTTSAYLSESAGAGSLWNAVNPNSTVITLGDFSMTNTNGNNYVAYCWAEVPGYSAFGSYTGNGSSDGPFVYLGFRPRWIMVKQSAGTSAASGSWQIFDTARDLYNPSDYRLQANSNGNEGTGAPSWDVLSNGFKLRSSNTNWNETSGTYVYAAFAETPARLSTAR